MSAVPFPTYGEVLAMFGLYGDLIVINAFDGKRVEIGDVFAVSARRQARLVSTVRTLKRARLWIRWCGDEWKQGVGPMECALDLPIRHTVRSYFLKPVVFIPT